MPNINSLLVDHVVLKYEFVDRIFLNGCVSRLPTPDDLAWFLCQHQRQRLPRYELLGEMTRTFVAAIEASRGVTALKSRARGIRPNRLHLQFEVPSSTTGGESPSRDPAVLPLVSLDGASSRTRAA